MPRRSRPLNATRSEFWLRKLINNNTDLLNDYLINNQIVHKNKSTEWLSPIVKDDFAEYYDEEFLDGLEIAKNKQIPLREFCT